MPLPKRSSVPLFLAAASLVLIAGRVEAQGTLGPALWQESISLQVQTLLTDMGSFMGSDPQVPEAHVLHCTGNRAHVLGQGGIHEHDERGVGRNHFFAGFHGAILHPNPWSRTPWQTPTIQ